MRVGISRFNIINDNPYKEREELFEYFSEWKMFAWKRKCGGTLNSLKIDFASAKLLSVITLKCLLKASLVSNKT